MANLQAYQITRKGPKHFRMEHADKDGNPNGEPYVGPLMTRDVTGHDKPTGRYALQCYAHADLAKNCTVPLKNVIRLTSVEAAKLAHMKLVPVVGAAPARDVAPATAPGEERVHIPADWHTLSARDRVKLAQAIIGNDEPLRAKEANRVIEDHIDGRQADAD